MRHQSQYQCYIDSTNTYFNRVSQNQNQINPLSLSRRKWGILLYVSLTLEIFSLWCIYKIVTRGILSMTLFTIRLRTYSTYSRVTTVDNISLFFLNHGCLLHLFKLQGKFNLRVSMRRWFLRLTVKSLAILRQTLYFLLFQLKDEIFG